MFIAMNRFQVKKGCEHDFEHVWLSRDTHLDAVPGFIEFHLLKGPEREDHVLYSSHTVWRSYQDFEVWTKSEQFRQAHAGAGGRARLSVQKGNKNANGLGERHGTTKAKGMLEKLKKKD